MFNSSFHIPVSRACGHVAEHEFSRRGSALILAKESMAITSFCSKCAAHLESLLSTAVNQPFTTSYALPQLSGSTAQIKWATDLRNKFLKSYGYLLEMPSDGSASLTALRRAIVLNLRQKNAKIWIEHRPQDGSGLYSLAADAIALATPHPFNKRPVGRVISTMMASSFRIDQSEIAQIMKTPSMLEACHLSQLLAPMSRAC